MASSGIFSRQVQYFAGLKARGTANSTCKGFKTGTTALNPASIATESRGTVTFTLTGARAGDMIHMQPPATLEDDLLFIGAEVTADDTVTVYLYNPHKATPAAVDGASLTWRYIWIDLT